MRFVLYCKTVQSQSCDRAHGVWQVPCRRRRTPIESRWTLDTGRPAGRRRIRIAGPNGNIGPAIGIQELMMMTN